MGEGETLVESSNIAAVRYMEAEQVLQVRFHGARTYQYLGVPREEYDGLMRSASHGKYLHSRIIPRYKAVRVGA